MKTNERRTTEYRIEADSMGEVRIPANAYWGAQTQRAVENFGISSMRIPKEMIRALALIKKHAARTNGELGVIKTELATAIAHAADEVLAGTWNDQFPIDMFQTGSGTSWNMNTNEVLANRANELLGAPLGQRSPVHPNDHVNRGQSSNDVIPTALHIADRIAVADLRAAMQKLHSGLTDKAQQFATIIKLGRTHLQDAVPMTLGQEFSGYATQIAKGIERLQHCLPNLEELALGGTAVGTGLNSHPQFAARVIAGISAESGIAFSVATNRFEAIATRDAQVELMAALNTISVSIMKIANDLRLLASGPRAGLGEIMLPSLQPGSSIMPGKVNPVIPEMAIQVAAFVMGKALSVTIAGQNSPLELNMMHPLIAHETITAMQVLAQCCQTLNDRCISGIEADVDRCAYWIEQSLALVTPLATEIGYDKAAQLAHRAYKERRTIREVAYESGLLSAERLDELLEPRTMVGKEESQ